MKHGITQFSFTLFCCGEIASFWNIQMIHLSIFFGFFTDLLSLWHVCPNASDFILTDIGKKDQY